VNIIQIVRDWLKSHPEYDGLANPELECGCHIQDLMPCEMPDFYGCDAGHIDKERSKHSYFIVLGPKQKQRDIEKCQDA